MRSSAFALLFATAACAADAPTITWQKSTLDTKFRSEGVAVADVNKDGKLDVLAGEIWYEAPDWKAHEMQKPGDYGDGLKGYSKIFACWAEDLNGDGWVDLIVIDFPGVPCYWLENPKGADTHWTKHTIWHSACNETPQYLDLLGTGKKVLIMGFQPKDKKPDGNEGQMAYFTPNTKDPNAIWDMHPISEASQPGKPIPGTQRYAHGLGAGDLNGDKRLDVITLGGWWEQPEKADGVTPWKFHPGGATDPASDLFAFDVDNDGVNDILSTSAHKFGIWWHKQRPANKEGHAEFTKNVLFPELVSETHAAKFVDIDGDGQNDLVTGKRWWSHGKSEPGSDKPASLYWFRVTRDKEGIAKFTPNLIDEASGIGTQFEVIDINKDGLPDIVTSNKRGVHVFVQVKK